MATFGLAHGSWHGGWCWGLLVDELVRRGHVCVAPDLPFDHPSSTWDTVTNVMTDALKGADDPVLVGHSFLQVDELGRDSWKPDDAAHVMYRHLEPALATWAAAHLRPDAVHGAYPLEGPPSLPSLYIYASEDEFFRPESRRWVARHVFGLEPVEIAGGHFPMLERPSTLADLLEASL